MKIPETNEDLRLLYQKMYTAENPDSEPYGGIKSRSRDRWFCEEIWRRVTKGGKILDASAGRGHLARRLVEMGYQVEVTEHVPYLIEHDLKPFPRYLLSYDELDKLPARSYDAVCSNDVLEHLPGEEFVRRALAKLARLSRGWLFICAARTNTFVGGKALGYGEKLDLHLFHPNHPERWWPKAITRVAFLDELSWDAKRFKCVAHVSKGTGGWD